MKLRLPGPGAVITAAFIGPGTVTTATIAGAQFGVSLLWALGFATLATIVLQEMSARLGLATRTGLGRALRDLPGPRWWGPALAAVAVTAVVTGAAAYEAGNLTGAALGLELAVGFPRAAWVGVGAFLALLLLWTGRYALVERALAACVAVMGIVFLLTALLVAPRVFDLGLAAFAPRFPTAGPGLVAVLGLIGTTIVPYNLFLHAAAARERWPGPEHLPAARWDLVVAISLGGVVSAAIVVTAAAALPGQPVHSAADMAVQLTPLLGGWASRAFAFGLGAAGLSSAVTAPLAAAYATLDAFRRPPDARAPGARAIWAATLAIGTVVAVSGFRPVPLILFAQVANGLILPLVAAVLLVAMNDRRQLGPYVNTWRGNLAGVAVVALCAVLGGNAIARVL